jgi:hypothetical protein
MYLFGDTSIGRSIFYAPTPVVTVTLPEIPRYDMNDITLLLFHCPKRS